MEFIEDELNRLMTGYNIAIRGIPQEVRVRLGGNAFFDKATNSMRSIDIIRINLQSQIKKCAELVKEYFFKEYRLSVFIEILQDRLQVLFKCINELMHTSYYINSKPKNTVLL